jgi:hypothetical protein
MEFDLHRIGTQRFDLALDFDLVLIDVDVERIRNCVSDVGIGHRTEELSVPAGSGLDRKRRTLDFGGEFFGVGQCLRFAFLLRALLIGVCGECAFVGF